MEQSFVEVVELLDSAAFHDVTIKPVHIRGHLDVFDGPEKPGGRVPQGVHIDPQVPCEEFTECFENSSFEVGIVLVFEQILKTTDAHRQGNGLSRIAR